MARMPEAIGNLFRNFSFQLRSLDTSEKGIETLLDELLGEMMEREGI